MNSIVLQVGVALAQAIALVMSVCFVTYVLIIVLPYMRHKAAVPGRASTYGWHLFVPALNEERVIGGTLDYLRATLPAAHIWVIDDGSDDATAEIVTRRAALDPYIHPVLRSLPWARQGKGEALNAAYQALVDWLPELVDRRRIVVGVIDADGKPAPNCLDVCAGPRMFGDPAVGSVQIMVRMINRHDRIPFPHRGRLVNFLGQSLVRLQDLEFTVPIAAIQMTRQLTRTVGLGGNGQFSRLSALDVVGSTQRRPWRGSLLEDYELSLHLLMTGHRNEYSHDTYVDQEGLPDIRRLVRQRTRWGQGTMQCCKYLSQLWTSPYVSRIGALEATYYMIQPWLQLVGTVVYPIPLAVFIANYASGPAAMTQWLSVGGWMLIFYYLTLGVGPFVLWGPVYKRRVDQHVRPLAALGLGLGYSIFVLMFYITSWRAFVRIIRGQSEWFKTRRNAEFVVARPRQPEPAHAGENRQIHEIIGGQTR
jgi:1,2-diacylglycerol 3-beta-glucosyltransferase